ncbi:MAG: HD domain-containing protein [Treponemataceae bacterium]
MSSPDYEKIRRIPHHDATVADHSVAVAYYSYKAARFFGMRSRLDELARGALLHDFFHYDWRTGKPRSGGLHGFDHPREALENAEAAFGPLSAVERDCVLRHMWPLTPIPPRYPESLIVCLMDKVVALGESWRALRAGKGLGVL